MTIEVASSADPEAAPFSPGQPGRQSRKKQSQGPPTLADAISGLFSP